MPLATISLATGQSSNILQSKSRLNDGKQYFWPVMAFPLAAYSNSYERFIVQEETAYARNNIVSPS